MTTLAAQSTIAATSTLAMVRTVERRGIPSADLLSDVGIPRAVLDDPDARLPAPAVLALWNALRERTGDPALQLVAPLSMPFGSYRVIDYLVGASATVGDGVERFAQFFRLIADAITMTIVDAGDEHHLCLALADGGAVPSVYVDYVFAAFVSRVRERIRPALAVQRVELRQAPPPSTTPYENVFRAPVQFGAPVDRLCFSAEEWRAPMDHADSTLAGVLEDHAKLVAARLATRSTGFTTTVHEAMTSVLPDGGSARKVARRLNVSVRTLQRRLVQSGTTFRAVSDEVRAQMAQEYLTDPAVSIAEVATLLGFSDETSFNRAFRRWTGDAPGRWRRSRALQRG